MGPIAATRAGGGFFAVGLGDLPEDSVVLWVTASGVVWDVMAMGPDEPLANVSFVTRGERVLLMGQPPAVRPVPPVVWIYDADFASVPGLDSGRPGTALRRTGLLDDWKPVNELASLTSYGVPRTVDEWKTRGSGCARSAAVTNEIAGSCRIRSADLTWTRRRSRG
jgi:hypothetical protein